MGYTWLASVRCGFRNMGRESMKVRETLRSHIGTFIWGAVYKAAFYIDSIERHGMLTMEKQLK